LFGLRPRTLWIGGVIVVMLMVALIVLPVGVARMLEGALRDRGATEVSIEDMDINLFDGTVDFYDVVASNPTGRLQVDLLEVEVSVWSIFASRLEVLDLTLSGGHLDLVQDADGVWQVGSFRIETPSDSVEPAETAETFAWEFGAHRASVENLRVTLQSAQLIREFELRSLAIQRAFSWRPTESLAIELSLRSGEAELDFSAQVTPFDEVLNLSGDMAIENLFVQDIRAPALAAALEHVAGTTNMEFDFTVAIEPGNTLDLELDGAFNLVDAAFVEQGVRLEAGEIEWRGTTVAQVDLKQGGESSFQVAGDITVAELSVRDSGDDFEFLSLSNIDLQDIDVSERRTSVEEVTVEDLQLQVQRLADGQLRRPGGEVPKSVAVPATIQAEVATASASYSAHIGQLAMLGNTQIHARDEQVDPVFAADLIIAEMQFSDIDTVSEQPMKLSLIASSSDSDRIEVNGSVAPFLSQPDADLTVILEGFDLSRFSSYVPGYNLERGRLALASVAVVTGGELDIQNKVTIDKLKFSGKTDDEDTLVATGAAMPLDVMLDLLRDSDDRIALEIPVTGSIDSVDVGYDQVIRKATQAALQKAAMSYVKSALQPLGTILFAVNLAGKAARPRFEPVLFNAGESVPTGEHIEYLDKIAGLLNKRPALGLTLCGVATLQDEIALTPSPISAPVGAEPSTPSDPVLEAEPAENPLPVVSEESLLTLAKARADAVKTSLTSQGVDAQQLFDCRPSFEAADDSIPRVEVML
jgi:hypothetical protein